MGWQYTPYTLPLCGAAAVSVALAIYAWRRRSAPGLGPSIVIMLAVTVWSFSYALELATVDLPAKLFWSRFLYLGIVIVPVAWLAFVFEYTNRTRWLTRRNLLLLALPSLAVLLMVWTNDSHHLIWTAVRLDTTGSFSMLVLKHGAAFWVMVAYIYASLLLGSALLFQVLSRRPRLYRGQAVAVLLGVLAPWVANILYLTGNTPRPGLDLTPLAFSLTCLAVFWGLFRFRLLDVVPVAHGALLDSMDNAMLVLDARGRIVDINPAAERLTAVRAIDAIGQPATAALSAVPPLARWLDQATEAHQEIALDKGDGLCVCDASSSTLRGRSGRTIGRLVVLRDITGRKRAEQDILSSELKYRTLFETSTDAIFVETLDGHVLDCNAAACDMLGYTKEELVGLTVADLVPEEVAKTLPALITAELTTGGAFVEATNRKKDGRVFPVEVSTRLVTVGEQQLAMVCVRDVSARKQIEQQSNERRLYLESVLACAPNAIVTLDAQQHVLDWNQGAEELFGYARQEVLGRVLDSLVAGPDEQALKEAARLTQQVLAGMPVSPIETIRYRKDGAPVEVILAGAPILVHGELAGVVASYRDISRRKRSERALKESESKYRTLVEQSLQGIVIAQGDPARIAFANAAMADIIGYSVEEILSFSPEKIWSGVYPEDRADFSQQYQERLTTSKAPHHYEIRLTRRDGTPRWAEIFTSSIELGGEPAVQAVFVDITERKRAEQELRASEEALRRRTRELALLNRVIAASAAGQGIKPILETACRELAAAFDLPHAAAALLSADKAEVEVLAEHYTGARASALGQTIPLADTPLAGLLSGLKAPLLIDDARSDPRLGRIGGLLPSAEPHSLLLLPLLIGGELAGGLGLAAAGSRSFSPEEVALAGRVADEVSGALARARLAEAERRLSAAVEQAAEAIVVTGPDATILYVNPAFEQIVGYTRAEVVGWPARILGNPRLDLLFQGWIWQTVTGGQPWREKVEFSRRDGRVCHLDMTIAPVRDPAGEIVSYVTTMRDVTRETQLEADIQQVERMEALGRLAGGIAHDFNNLLAVIQLSAQILERKLPPGDRLLDDVAPISRTVQRATGLTRQLVRFSRGEMISPRLLNLNHVIGDLSTMIQMILGHDARLVTVLADDLWPILAGPAQIEQVITNLAVNARDAMPAGGTLTVETANVILDQAYADLHLEAQPGEYVMLAVSDTGTGMDDEVKARIFEPFFTTKEPGHGTGLGLANVFGIVKQGGGQIEVHSQVGRGTTFKIYLPRAQGEQPAPEAPARPLPAAPDRPIRGTETVLLLEDDAPIRELAARVLESCGYLVLAAADAMEALQIGERHGGPIHLLFTDVMLPYMSGGEAARQLLDARPEMRVLYTSGYTDSAAAHQGILPPGISFLPKPYTIEDLTRAVRDILDLPPTP